MFVHNEIRQHEDSCVVNHYIIQRLTEAIVANEVTIASHWYRGPLSECASLMLLTEIF